MITYNNKNILKSFIGNKRVVRKYLNNKIVYGIPDFAQYYNIQGYDNYQVVGNPTIADGVASGFTTTDYITTQSAPKDLNVRNYELFTKIRIDSIPTFTEFIMCYHAGAREGISIINDGRIRFMISRVPGTTGEPAIYSSACSAGDEVLIHTYYKGNNIWVLEISKDNGTTWETNTRTVTSELSAMDTSRVFTIGGSQFYPSAYKTPFVSGSIDLNNTYIKVNGKYLFNGNPNYKELLDCNPNVYLQSSGVQYIDTGVTADNTLSFDITFKNKDLSSTRYFMYNSDGWGNKMFSLLWYVPYSQFIFYLQSSDYYMYQVLSNTSQASDKIRLVSETTSAVRSFQTYINGVLIKSNTHAEAVSFSQHNILIGNTEYLGYAVKLCKNGVLIRHFVPVPEGLQIGSYKVPSNGMFDIVEQKFYANVGSGEFIWGVDL